MLKLSCKYLSILSTLLMSLFITMNVFAAQLVVPDAQIVLFTIANMAANKYSLIPHELNNEQQARIYAQSPTMKIVLTDEETSQLDLVSKNLTEFEAEVAFQEMEPLNIKALIKYKHNIEIAGNPIAINALEKLKLWWAQADEKQKK